MRYLTAFLVLHLAGAALALPKLTYVVRVIPQRAEWRVLVIGEGIDASIKDVGVFLPTWGDWLKLGPRMLTSFHSDPPAVPAAKPGSFKLRVPRGWNGKLRVVYTLRPALVGSKDLATAPLALRRGDDFQLGFAKGTLLGLSEQIYEQPAERTLFVIPPRGWVSATGYAPARDGMLRVPMDESYRNGVIAVAPRARVARGEAVETPIEVVQLGEGELAAPAIRDTLVAAWHRICHDVGDIPLPRVSAVLQPASSWGTFTPNGIHLGFELDDRVQPGKPLDTGYERIVVHELAHAWLGHALQPAQAGMSWFSEGFTEYVALRSIAAAGLEDRVWFGRALLSYRRELEGNRHATSLPFLGADRDWRENDDVEMLIYKKAPLVAFALDVALRKRGHPGVPRMIGEIIRTTDRIDPEGLVRWLDEHGMRDFTARYLTGAAMPDVVGDLAAAGIRVTQAPARLAHVGLRLESGSGLTGTIAEVEPGSPAARAGLSAGERIYAVTPLRPIGGQLIGTAPTRFTYGLRTLEPDRPTKIRLDGRAVTLTPRASPGIELKFVESHSSTIPNFFINR
jgi:hypothetical protein